MKISSMLILAVASGALAAQEAPRLDGRFQVFAEMSRPAEILVATPSPAPNVEAQPKRQTGGGFRFLGELSSAPGFYYELGGMFDASSYFTYSGAVNGNLVDMTNAKVTDSYWSLGAAWLHKFNDNLTLGAHLEGRGEYLRLQGEIDISGTFYQLDHSTTYLRPWLRGSLDYTFTGIGKDKHPYVGLDGSLALLRTSQNGNAPDFSNIDDRTVRALAPRAAGALYVGIRF